MSFSPRLRYVTSEGDALREMLSLGIDPAEARQLAPASVRRIVRLTGVPLPLVETLKGHGGAVMVLAGPPALGRSELLLIGTRSEFAAFLARAKEDGPAEDLCRELKSLMTPEEGRRRFLLGRHCRLSLERPLIMGVLNATPDSFFSESRSLSLEKALRRGENMAAEGADLLDVGGESTRPGSQGVSEEEELDRVVPLIEALKRELDLPVSVDTTKSGVAREAVAAGADFINDISGLRFDPQMARTASESGAGLFLMHTPGRPDRMQARTTYRDLVGEVLDYLRQSLEDAREAGIPPEKLAVDPGIGFGKSVGGNLEILSRLREFTSLGHPILIGTSRKSFIGQVLGQPDPGQRLQGTMATVAIGVFNGADIVRVHDVRPAREAAHAAWAILQGEGYVGAEGPTVSPSGAE